MTPTLARKRLDLPTDTASTKAYLQKLQIELGRDADMQAARVFKHFTALAQEGYGLDYADATAEMEARAKLSMMPRYFSITEINESTRKILGRPSEYEARVKAKVGDKDFYEIDESPAGSVHAFRSALRKILRLAYPETNSIRLIGYHVDSFRLSKEENNIAKNHDQTKEMDEDDKIDTASPTRVTVVFSTLAHGKKVTYAVQDVQPGVMDASMLAVAKGLQYGLFRQGIAPL